MQQPVDLSLMTLTSPDLRVDLHDRHMKRMFGRDGRPRGSTGNRVSTTGLATNCCKSRPMDNPVTVNEPDGSSGGCEPLGWGEYGGGDKAILGAVSSESIDGWWTVDRASRLRSW